MRSSDEAKEQVRNATDIVQIVGERVPLRRAGRAWKGLCPFHAEKTPSFTVNPERQMWHCFGCNRGGDVFAFVMEIDRIAFPEALALLAERAGVELPRAERGPMDAVRDRIYQANALAADFFKASLLTPAGEKARRYLASRGFEGAILERFQIGWAPEGWDGLAVALGKLLPGKVLEQAGLVARRGDGTHYDRFRGRIVFPIEVRPGRVAGFGARAVDPADTPKYLNSPETPVYRKGGVLYGLPLARSSIRESRRVLVAEGYLDVMRLHAEGFTNAVSTCGTALTPEQARALSRFEAEAVLVYDGDEAGLRAADRALDPLLQAGVAAQVALLPPGEDPDSFLAKLGAEALRKVLAEAPDPAGFLARAGASGPGANPPAEARVRRYVELLGRVEDPIRRRLMVRRGAEAFDLEEGVLLESLARAKGGRRTPRAESGTAPRSRASEPKRGSDAGPTADAPAPSEPLDPVERELAARVLTEEGAMAAVIEAGGSTCFQNPRLRSLLQSWLDLARPPLPDEARDLTDRSPLARALLAEHAIEEGRTDDLARKGARELLQRMEERRLRASIHALDEAIRQAERSEDNGSIDRLIAERRDLTSRLHGRGHAAIS
jgi:DNA primase